MVKKLFLGAAAATILVMGHVAGCEMAPEIEEEKSSYFTTFFNYFKKPELDLSDYVKDESASNGWIPFDYFRKGTTEEQINSENWNDYIDENKLGVTEDVAALLNRLDAEEQSLSHKTKEALKSCIILMWRLGNLPIDYIESVLPKMVTYVLRGGSVCFLIPLLNQVLGICLGAYNCPPSFGTWSLYTMGAFYGSCTLHKLIKAVQAVVEKNS